MLGNLTDIPAIRIVFRVELRLSGVEAMEGAGEFALELLQGGIHVGFFDGTPKGTLGAW